MPAFRTIILALLAMAFLGGPVSTALAQAGAPETPQAPPTGTPAALPEAVELRTGWEFRFDNLSQGLRAGWKSGAWDEDWTNVEVPHVFNGVPSDQDFNGTIGWYRIRFATPAAPEGFAWALRFEGARRVARVWLNGTPLGTNANPYSQFVLPADGINPAGQVNELVVRVHNVRPATLREGWWNWGGITRPVTLVPVGQVAYQDVGLLSDVTCPSTCRAIVRTDGWLLNRTSAPVSPTITVRLTSPQGALTERRITVAEMAPGERRRVRFHARIGGVPQLWSPKVPNLYDGTVEVKLGEQVEQLDRRRVGLRYIRVANGALYLNGHRLQVRGASFQEDLPGRGPALRNEDMETIVADLKSLGANVTRAQYPLNERLLERFDQEGILVWSQAPVYHEDLDLRSPLGRHRAYAKVRGTVLFARNHPSVMTHSVANELTVEPDTMPGSAAFLRHASWLARDLDHTVPASVDLLSYPNIPFQRAYAGYGLLGINSYYGWYRGKPGPRSTARLSDLGPYLQDMRRKYRRAAMMITEFGAEATFDGPPTVKETFAFQSRYLDRTMNIVDRLGWLSGAIYWTAREFYVKPNWDGGANRKVPRDALHNKGLITYDGQRKAAWLIARDRFAGTPIYREEPRATR